MNSSWKVNLIIFTMVVVPTCSDTQIKIRVSGALESQPRVKLSRSWRKSPSSSGLMQKHEKCFFLGWFWPTLTFNQPKVDQGHFGQFDLKGTSIAPMPKQVAPCQSRCFYSPMEKNIGRQRSLYRVYNRNMGRQSKARLGSMKYWFWK